MVAVIWRLCWNSAITVGRGLSLLPFRDLVFFHLGPLHMAAWAASYYGSWIPKRTCQEGEFQAGEK